MKFCRFLAALAWLAPCAVHAQGFQPTSSSGYGLQPMITSAAANSFVVKTSPGNLYAAYATNQTAFSGFFVLINSTSIPSNGSAITPYACVLLPAGATVAIPLSPISPMYFTSGIIMAVTSAANCFTFTTGVVTAFFSGLAS